MKGEEKENKFNYVSFDFEINNTEHIYGLPERMTDFDLKDTDDKDAYRLYNLDFFNRTGKPLIQSLYGSIPLIHSISTDCKIMFSFLFNNTTDTWIDVSSTIKDKNPCKQIRAVSQGGILEFYVFADTNFQRNFYKLAKLTGFAKLPPIFSLGYHQCRWGYNSQEEITEVDINFDKNDIPYDVLWLDIDVSYTL